MPSTCDNFGRFALLATHARVQDQVKITFFCPPASMFNWTGDYSFNCEHLAVNKSQVVKLIDGFKSRRRMETLFNENNIEKIRECSIDGKVGRVFHSISREGGCPISNGIGR